MLPEAEPTYTQRYLRQIALPEIGPEGQQRLATAVIAVASEHDDDVATETAARYLAAAGVGTVRWIAGAGATEADRSGETSADGAPVRSALRASNPDVVVQERRWPADGAAWLAALQGVDLVVRSGFDDDPMLRAAVHLGVPAIILKVLPERVELIAFRKQGPCPHLDLDIPARRADGARGGAAAVVAGTLSAAEALFMLVGRASGSASAARARHLSVPLDGGAPRAQEIPWAPECFACGGGAVEMVFS